MHRGAFGLPLPGLAHGQGRGVHRSRSDVLRVEPRRADDALDQIIVEERFDRAGLPAGPSQHQAVGGLPPVDREELPGHRLEVALLLLADPVVVRVLAPAWCRPYRCGTACRGCCRPGARQLPGVVRRHLEKPRGGPVEHHGQEPPEFVLHRRQLAHQRRAVHRQARTVHHRERQRLEQSDPFAGEDRQTQCRGQVGGSAEILLHPLQVAHHFVVRLALEAEPGQRLGDGPDPILELDQILAAAPVPGLQLEVAAHHPMRPGFDRGQSREALRQRRRRRLRPPRHCRPASPPLVCGQKKTGSR